MGTKTSDFKSLFHLFLLRNTFNPRGEEKLLPIHSFKRNQNDVFTTCKAIIKGLPSGLMHWTCALRQKPKINGFEKEKNMVVEGGTVSHFYSLVTCKCIDSMSLFRHNVWLALHLEQALNQQIWPHILKNIYLYCYLP